MLIIPLVNYETADIDIIRKKWVIAVTEIGFLSFYAISHVYLSISLIRKVNAEMQFS